MAYNVFQSHPPKVWHLAPAPLPPRGRRFVSEEAAERAERIRQLFLAEFRRGATVAEVIEAAHRHDLLAGVHSPRAQHNVICSALSVIAVPLVVPR